jgi:HAD superfamily hydrolase (TIGR01484 family)
VANKGIKIVFVTGRNKHFCEKIARRLRLECDFISDSGGRITIQKETKKFATIDNKIAQDLSQALQTSGIRAVMGLATANSQIFSNAWTHGKLWEMFLKTYSVKDLFLSQRIHVTKQSYNRNLHQAQILRILIIYTSKYEIPFKEFMKTYQEKYASDLEFNYGNKYLEITAFGCNKAHALSELIDFYGFTKDQVIVVGDEGNDYDMIREFPNSFAMEQGSEIIKGVAKHVIEYISDIDKFMKL